MNTKLVAKITTERTGGGTRTGTGYPIAANLLITARHVIEFDERDKNQPIKVEWQDFGESIVIEPKDIKFKFNGGEQLVVVDVVLLYCTIPDAVAKLIPLNIQETEKITTRNGWETVGFPKVNDFKAKDATGIFGSDLEKLSISLTLDDTIDKEIFKTEHGWGGMSGAPVFCIKTQKLQAIITDHNQWMQKQLIGTSIPYLMKLPEFRKALGLNDADEQHKKYLAGLPHRITKQLRQIEKNRLYQTLASEFISGGIEKSPENLWQAIEDKINSEPLNLLEQYRKTVERVLKEEPKHINEAQTLFLLFLGFFSEPEDIATAVHQVHQLSVKTRLAVEIYLAARYGLTPDLLYEPGVGIDVNQSARGRFAIDGENEFREVGWDVKANAKELIKMTNIAINKVHESVHGQKPTDDLDDFALESLNETIKTRRQGEYPQLIRVEVPFKKTSEQNHPLHNDDVCAILFELLPSLPIVRYGSGSAKIEPRLCAQVNEFFRIIKQYSQDS